MRQAYDYWQDQPGFCVPSAVDRGLQQPCHSQKASAQRVRIEQTRHKYRDKSTNVWLTLSKAKQAAKLSKSKLQQPILAWKAGTNAADFTKPKFTQQVQTHKPEPNAKRCKQPYTQHPFSNLQTPLAAVIARVRTSQQNLKGSFTTPVDLRSGFAAPVNLRMQFVRLVAIGRQLCLQSASGSSFATPFGRKLPFCPSHRKSGKSPKTPIFRGTKNRIFEARKNRRFPGFRKIRISELSPGMLNRIFRGFPLRDFP